MTLLAGQNIVDVMSLRDTNGTLVTGATWTVLYSKTQAGTAFDTTVTETASAGTYLVESETDIAGAYHRILSASKNGVTYGWSGTAHVVSGSAPFEAMADQVYSEVIYVTDADGAGVAGISWTTQNTYDPDGNSFTLTVSDVAGVDGGYVATLTPDAIGAWRGELVTDTDPVQRFTVAVDVSAAGAASSLTITQGVAYLRADGTALTWTDAAWPVLNDVLVTVHISPGFNQKVYEAITIEDATVSLDLSAADTATMTAGQSYSYELRGEFDRGRTQSLTVGVMTVVAA